MEGPDTEGLRLVQRSTHHSAVQINRAVQLVDCLIGELETTAEAVALIDSLTRILAGRRAELVAIPPPQPQAAA